MEEKDRSSTRLMSIMWLWLGGITVFGGMALMALEESAKVMFNDSGSRLQGPSLSIGLLIFEILAYIAFLALYLMKTKLASLFAFLSFGVPLVLLIVGALVR